MPSMWLSEKPLAKRLIVTAVVCLFPSDGRPSWLMNMGFGSCPVFVLCPTFLISRHLNACCT